MIFISFGSGSSGNCYYIHADHYGILIDLGIGIRKFKKAFKDYGFIFPEIKAILVTHEHTDHIKAVGVLANELHIPVYATKCVHQGIMHNVRVQNKVAPTLICDFEHDTSVQLGPFDVTSFKIPHDSADNSGYFIRYADTNLCLITDVGHINEPMKYYISKSINLVVEANYDERLLEQGPYPYYLKQRIRSENGHMSNEVLAQYLAAHANPDLQNLWLCHLSEENNRPDIARQTIVHAFSESGWPEQSLNRIVPLNRKIPSGPYSL